ncbi:NAD(P)-dependent oxidoreductase [Flavobacterium sp. DG2-3]|uniref:NAD-dependent epimerase/dehydratase family protein n=1 Tax=Flavobacterium sp. DG2-3 TaxID=3068317 RepID=UPI00273FB731|nr:NAD(P)-dependent oxidoreductase [Flavobacterium sp. DG2-3]MDP5200698.1 NAD(P)-dependent oxidoreductase [Flavobacterium sp. DG2-3]
MNVLIFGSNGFLGKELNQLLKTANHSTYTVSRSKDDAAFKVDISNSKDFENLPLNFFDVVINCATVLPGGDYLDNDFLDRIYKTNILGTQNICKWIEGQNTIRKIINCSTLAVVKKPWPIELNENVNTYPTGRHVLYSFSKLGQELLFDTFANFNDIIVSHVRFSALYGKNMISSGIITNIIDQIKKTNNIQLTNASKVNADFLYVEDAARIIAALIENNFDGVINGATGTETSILQLAEIIKKNFKDQSIKILNTEDQNFLEDRAVICIENLKKIIDINTFSSLEEGIKKMIS